jgi:hypothetical protein
MQTYLEALLELSFCTKTPNFGAEAHWSCSILGESQWHGHRHLMDCHIGFFNDMTPNK